MNNIEGVILLFVLFKSKLLNILLSKEENRKNICKIFLFNLINKN